MKLLDLFSGIGGFSYAAEKHGFFTTAFCEIDSFCQKVIKKHFPDRPIYNDVCDVRGFDLELVDVVTFGSPCQDLSVAGKRDGLKGEQSSLFFEAIRIIREMRERTDGRYPRYAVWENVLGAFSSNKGQDFRTVLEAFLETEIPMPRSGRWATAGMVRGDGRSVAWRVLDAQYWGVPQRRRRIFLVCDFRGQSAPEILFEPQSVSRDTSESGKTGKKIAANTRDGIKTYCLQSSMINKRDKNRHTVVYPKVTGTLCASGARLNRPAGMGSETELLVAQCLTTDTGKRYDPETETLIPVLADQGGSQIGISYDLSPTLRAQEHGHQPIIPTVFRYQNNQRGIVQDKVTATLRSQSATTDERSVPAYIISGYLVRRLTPLECLRLQGFPDDWLDGLGLSDSAKYRMIGNSVAIPCVEFVMGNIAMCLLEEDYINWYANEGFYL